MTTRVIDEEDLEGLDQAPTPLMIGLGVTALIVGLVLFARRAAADVAEKLELSVTLAGPSKPKLAEQMALARALLDGLATGCPGAPTLNSVIKRIPVELQDGNFRIVYTFDANFSGDFDPNSAFVKDAVGECMLGFIKKNASFGGRILGIRAKRIQ